MALLHWWPLNGDTKDYGVNSGNDLTLTTYIFDDQGKINEKSFNPSLSTLFSSSGGITCNIVSGFSICAWVKVSTDTASGNLSVAYKSFGTYCGIKK